MKNISHDAAYKAFFSNREMIKSLLLDFVSEEFVEDLDFSTLKLCSNSYVTPDLKNRQDDVVWRLSWKNTCCYIYILLEFQRTPDYWMALRISSYSTLLWQALVREGEIKQGDKLPPIFPLVVYNGTKVWNKPTEINKLIHVTPESLANYQLSQQFFYWISTILIKIH